MDFVSLKDNFIKLNKYKQEKPKWKWNIKEDQNWDTFNQQLINDVHKIDKSTLNTFSNSFIENITNSMQKILEN